VLENNINHIFFFWIRGNLTPRKAHFMGLGERVKPRLSQALTRGARTDSNSRPAVQISSPLTSRYAPWRQYKSCPETSPNNLSYWIETVL